MLDFEEYWLFLAFCVTVGLLLMRLVLRERITLQGSLQYSLFLTVLVAFAVFPHTAARLAELMGFTLVSNFFFAVTAAMFALLHLAGLIAHSRAELRIVALVQEHAILREQMERLTARVDELAQPRAAAAPSMRAASGKDDERCGS